MIVVLGAHRDPVATALVAAWPGAALCSAQDLCAPGWVWPLADVDADTDANADVSADAGAAAGGVAARRWVVQGRAVADEVVSGVFVARSAVHAAELQGTHPQDRAYLAAELTAFVTHLLASTGAKVSTPVVDGAFGDATLRPERWMPLAARCGLTPVPLRLQSAAPAAAQTWAAWPVDVVGQACFGEGLARLAPARRAAATRLVAALGLAWARLLFDGACRLRLIGTLALPNEPAREALGRALLGRGT